MQSGVAWVAISATNFLRAKIWIWMLVFAQMRDPISRIEKRLRRRSALAAQYPGLQRTQGKEARERESGRNKECRTKLPFCGFTAK